MRHVLLAVLLLIASPLAAQTHSTVSATGFRYEKRGSSWYRSERGVEYQVDPRVVTVRFADESRDPREALSSLAESASGSPSGSLDGLRLIRSNVLGIHDLEIPEGGDPLQVVADLRKTGLCAFAEENTIGRHHFIPNDPVFSEQWNYHNLGQSGGTPDADVDAPEAWDIEDGDPSIVIAVIDSGADDAHPDLAANIWTNPGEILNGLDDDNNGFIDDIRGWDFVENDNDPVGNTGHGTAVAGMPGSVGSNGLDLAGLVGGAMDGSGCRIMNLQMSNAMIFQSSAVDDALLYAADNGAHVATMSLGIGSSTAMNMAIDYAHDVKGLFVNCSTSNSGNNVTYPAKPSHRRRGRLLDHERHRHGLLRPRAGGRFRGTGAERPLPQTRRRNRQPGGYVLLVADGRRACGPDLVARPEPEQHHGAPADPIDGRRHRCPRFRPECGLGQDQRSPGTARHRYVRALLVVDVRLRRPRHERRPGDPDRKRNPAHDRQHDLRAEPLRRRPAVDRLPRDLPRNGLYSIQGRHGPDRPEPAVPFVRPLDR